MRNRKLPGTVLIAIFLFSHTSFSWGASGSGHSDHCQQHCDHGTCVRHHGNNGYYYDCKCDHGWHGDHCTQEYAPTGTLQCHNTYCVHGNCWYSKDQSGHQYNHHCVCHEGWDGKHCDQQLTTVSSTTHIVTSQSTPAGTQQCHNTYCVHGNCGYSKDQLGHQYNHHCVCHHGWDGKHCDQQLTTHGTIQCHNTYCVHGTCGYLKDQSGHQHNHHCVCHHGWDGKHCDQQLTTNGTLHCNNTNCVHGTCWYLKDQSGHQYNHHCVCHHGWDGKHCDQQLTTVSSTTHSVTSTITPAMSSSPTTQTTTTQKTTTQTTLPAAPATYSYAPTSASLTAKVTTSSISSVAPLSVCDHINTLSAIARQTTVANQNAIECSRGSHTSHEAFVLTECSVPQNPSSWRQGVNTMADCGSSAAIPTYTPVAAYDHGSYSSVGSLSGIFLGCTSNGFKIALQTCGQAPHITELQLGGSNTQNPNMYYTIS